MSDKMREALKLAIRQNEHDMLMTGEELRLCRDAIAQAEQRTEAVIDTCDHGHQYAKLPGHPMRDGKPRCPHCMATGLDAARAEQRGEAVASEWRKRFGENPLSSTRRSECDEYTWRLMVLCQDMMAALERTAPPAQAEQRSEVVGWLTDQGTFHFDKTDAWNDSEGFIKPLYEAPPAPAVPDDVAKDAARYRWMVEHCADVSRHQGNGKWCCQWFDHQGKGAALHCTEWHETAAQAVDAAMLAAAPEVKP